MSERAGPPSLRERWLVFRRRLPWIRAWTLTWLAYATYYLGRKGISVSKGTMRRELGLSEAALGAIDTAYLAAYALGQFVNGILGDHVGARRLIGFGLFGTALACAAFGASSTALVLGFFFLLNGLFQATGWPGTTRAMAEWTTPKNRGTVMAFWSTCYQFGGLIATAVCSALIVRYGFRSTFFVPALLMAVMGVLILAFLRAGPMVQTEGEQAPSPSGAERKALIATAQAEVWKSGLLWSYGASYFFIKFIRYALLLWLPYYLSTMAGYAPDLAGYVSIAFEGGGIVGVIALGILSDVWKRFSRAALSAMALIGLSGAFFVCTEFAGRDVLTNVVCLSLVGAFLFGPDALLSGAATQDAGGRYAPAAATGFVNGVGSIGGMIEGLALPQLSKHLGWQALFPSFIVLALAAAAALIPALVLQRRSPASTPGTTPPR